MKQSLRLAFSLLCWLTTTKTYTRTATAKRTTRSTGSQSWLDEEDGDYGEHNSVEANLGQDGVRSVGLRNNCKSPVHIFWIDPRTNEVYPDPLYSLPQGHRTQAKSYVSHRFTIYELPQNDSSSSGGIKSSKTKSGCLEERCKKASFVVSDKGLQTVTITTNFTVLHYDHTTGHNRLPAEMDVCLTRAYMDLEHPNASFQLNPYTTLRTLAYDLNYQITQHLRKAQRRIRNEQTSIHSMSQRYEQLFCNQPYPHSAMTLNATTLKRKSKTRRLKTRTWIEDGTDKPRKVQILLERPYLKTEVIPQLISAAECRGIMSELVLDEEFQDPTTDGTHYAFSLEWTFDADHPMIQLRQRIYEYLEEFHNWSHYTVNEEEPDLVPSELTLEVLDRPKNFSSGTRDMKPQTLPLQRKNHIVAEAYLFCAPNNDDGHRGPGLSISRMGVYVPAVPGTGVVVVHRQHRTEVQPCPKASTGETEKQVSEEGEEEGVAGVADEDERLLRFTFHLRAKPTD